MTETENDSVQGDMSYLYGRDPSIVTIGQRPLLLQKFKKNLISLLEEEINDNCYIENQESISVTSDTDNQTIKVFLRMKPIPPNIKLTKEQSEVYKILNSTTLITKMPANDSHINSTKKNRENEIVYRNFTFSRTFGPETTQLDLFELAVKPQIVDFLAGKNSVVMTYGTTNSGKTYTIQGTSENPGIIPRSIEYIFRRINPTAIPHYKPINNTFVIDLAENDRLQEIDLKMKLLNFAPVNKNCFITTYKQMEQLLQKESPQRDDKNQNVFYSVWLSFAEIYNETVYDLLRTECYKKRPALKLAVDNKGRTFIKGLRNICVCSGIEAYQVFMAGQYNLKVAATALNSKSSRSHCIFSIKLLKYKTHNDPSSVDISVFSFCDLAGSERLKKTLNVGERLKEAQNINTSLLVLGRCLKTIYETQTTVKNKNELVGPFRESKLTRIFQRALSGKEQIALIVNVNPIPNLYIETQNVLNFSAIAKKIILEKVQDVEPKHMQSRFSRIISQSMKENVDWDDTELDELVETDKIGIESCFNNNTYDDLLMENDILKRENEELKVSAFKRDMETRREMTDLYTNMIKKLEADWKNRIADMELQQEGFLQQVVNQTDNINNYEDDQKINIKEIELENNLLKIKVDALMNKLHELKKDQEKLKIENSKLVSELMASNEKIHEMKKMLLLTEKDTFCGDQVTENQIKELKEMLDKKNDRIKAMKIFLNEAKEEFIRITNQSQEKDYNLKTSKERLAEKTERIHDLEEQLNEMNVHSLEQTKLIEALENDFEQYIKKETKIKNDVANFMLELVKLLGKQNNDCNDDPHQNEYAILNEMELVLEKIKLKLKLFEDEKKKVEESLRQREDKIKCFEMITKKQKKYLYEIEKVLSNIIIQCSLKTHHRQSINSESRQKNIINTTESQNDLQVDDTHYYQKIIANLDTLKSSLYKCSQTLSAEDVLDKNVFDTRTNIFKLSESEKDKEIESLQKELKFILKELRDAKEKYTKSEEKCAKIDKDYRQIICILEEKIRFLDQCVSDKVVENAKLHLKSKDFEKPRYISEEDFKDSLTLLREFKLQTNNQSELPSNKQEETEPPSKKFHEESDQLSELQMRTNVKRLKKITKRLSITNKKPKKKRLFTPLEVSFIDFELEKICT